MLMFVLIALAIVALVSAVTAWIWFSREGPQNSSDDPEWQVLLAKRDEIENDALLPPETRETLRREWAEMAAEVLPKRQAQSSSDAPSKRFAIMLSVASALLGAGLYGANGQWDEAALKFGSATSANSTAGQAPSGRRRTGVPVSANSALATAGAMTGTAGSPTPVGALPDGTMCTSMTGVSTRPMFG
jgi:hypothetical protein